MKLLNQQFMRKYAEKPSPPPVPRQPERKAPPPPVVPRLPDSAPPPSVRRGKYNVRQINLVGEL